MALCKAHLSQVHAGQEEKDQARGSRTQHLVRRCVSSVEDKHGTMCGIATCTDDAIDHAQDAPAVQDTQDTATAAPLEPSSSVPAREDWLTSGVADFAALGGQSKRQLADAAAQAKQAKDDEISTRELNPNLAAQRDGRAAPAAGTVPSGRCIMRCMMIAMHSTQHTSTNTL